MLAGISSAAVVGIDAYAVTVEVDAAQGLPQWAIVGLPAGAVKESRDRVGSALVNSGFSLPARRITVNLAPADTRKEGTAFDLPIAVGLLVATGQLAAARTHGKLFVGELGLDGTVRSVRGALSLARYASRVTGGTMLVLPRENLAEAARVPNVALATPRNLAELVGWLASGEVPRALVDMPLVAPDVHGPDWADVIGQSAAKRALEIAAAGAHNALLVGPPGTGKTMLARRLTTVLPPLSEDEALEVIAIASVAGTLTTEAALAPRRPFRSPHHSISTAGLVGGGSGPRPGEVSLAHHGVLFLDEMLEFPRSVLEALRQPMEDGEVVVARAAQSVRFPARFMLVGATNPCPCGRAEDPRGSCVCSSVDVARYQARMSGPLADRIDMHVAVPPVTTDQLADNADGERSETVRMRVAAAHGHQRARYSRAFRDVRNAHVPGRWLDTQTPIHREARALLQRACSRLDLSARGYHRVLKVARTIADLDGEREMSPAHVAEALRYRVTHARDAPERASSAHTRR